jgi:hypothetical protein
MARAFLAAWMCLLFAVAVCRADNKKLTVKTSEGSSRVMARPGQGRVVVRGVNLSITNNYTRPVTAYVIWGDNSLGGEDPVTANVYSDSVIHEKDQPILPGQTRTEKSSDPTTLFRAAVFADGSGFGDPVWIERIFHHRQLYLQLTDRAIGCVEAVLLPPPKRVELLQKLGFCPWDLKAPGSTPEEENISYPLFQEVWRDVRPPQGESLLSEGSLQEFREESQKLRRVRAQVADTISTHHEEGEK